jgi:hypothetical protein
MIELAAGFDEYASVFEAESLFTGPSLYFHHKTLAIRAEHGGSIERCLRDRDFLESLYATLTAWGLHRMGPGNTKLVEFPLFTASLAQTIEKLKGLEGMRIDRLGPREFARTVEILWDAICGVHIGIGATKLVAGTKALHPLLPLLPDLVPPIDREYTVRFFLENKGAIQGDEVKQGNAFRFMYSHFAAICHNKQYGIEARMGTGMNTSRTKVVDNAIVGYCRKILKVKADSSETES